MIRILLVDDHALFRESLSRLLASETDLEIVGQCGTVEEAIRLIESTNPGLVLLDYELGDRRGNEIVSAARAHGYEGRILLVTVGLTPAELQQMLRHGVSGIFLKNNSPELLLEAIETVVAGERWLDPKYQEPACPVERAPEASKPRFTDRDRQVLRAVFEGLANKEIADRIGVSESAIKASLQQLFAKTGVRTRSQLVRVALENYRRELL